MIYESVDKKQPIRQGDIFYPLPIGILRLNRLFTIQSDGIEEEKWESIKNKEKTFISLPILPSWGIVATQDCDCERAPLISFFQILPFTKTTSKPEALPSTPKKWQSYIVRQSRENAKWFYLPVDDQIGFKEKMAVSFHNVFQINREDLEEHKTQLRKGRLVDYAYQHYRESIAQYFRRYPYDEWYPLSKEEFKEYRVNQEATIKPFTYQE